MKMEGGKAAVPVLFRIHPQKGFFFTYHAFKGREGNVSRTNLAERFKIEHFWVDKKYLDLLSLCKIFSWTIPYPAFEGLEIKKCECKVIFKGVSEIIHV